MTAGCTAVLLGASASTAPLVLAEETPQQALQAVTVELGTDGAITALTSALVSQDEDGSQTRTRELDPGENAADLPVRVTTSWRHDGRVGTDLAELAGVSGRVEVNVTVQNTTVRPERFQYDSGGVLRDRYELVTTPLTVVASAVLPEGSGASLVRPQPGAAEPGTTNGVVSTDGTATTVQWATLLAPPRLSASTTFTLVQDAEDFRLPEIDVAVQPGLATDTSIASLVGSTFGGSAGRVASENNTIALIAGVNATLAEVADSLQQVRQTLSTNAGEVGAAATAALDRTADSVDTAAQSVLADLQALDDSVGSTVESTNSQAMTSLRDSIRGVLDYFGTPAAAPGGPASAGCGAQAADEAPAATLLGQLSTVSRQLRELGAASGDCVQDLRASLRDSIGDEADCADATDTLVCRLIGAGSQLVEVAVDVRTRGAQIAGVLDTAAVDLVGQLIEDLVTAVRDVQADGAALRSLLVPGTTVTQLQAQLDALGDGIGDATAAVDDVETAAVRAELTEITGLADQQLAELQGPGSVSVQLTALADAVCDLAVADPAQLDESLALLTGEDCDGDPLTSTDFDEPLTQRIADDVTAWQSVKTSAATARDELDDIAPELTALQTQLTGLAAPLGQLQTLVDGPVSDRGLQDGVADLLDAVDALYVHPGGPAWECGDPPVESSPLNAVATHFAAVDCSQDQVRSNLEALLQQAADRVRAAGEEQVAATADDAAEAGSAADAALAELSEALMQRLGETADRQTEQGRAVVAAQQAQLAATQAAAEQDLDASAQDAVARLAEQVSAANQSQSAAAAQLQAQLAKVLVDLGSARDGRGLLGVMQDSAGQAGVRTEQVQQTSQTAASFGGVRMTELADAQLEQQQLVRALQSADTYDAFAEDLPDGSTSATVFTFRLAGEQ
ncbi:hypothetical protein [Geodermatophilus sp. SYSU D01105]